MTDRPIVVEASGAGITFLRVYRGIADHFPARRSEWVTASMLFWWGVVVMQPYDLFGQGQAWKLLLSIMSERHWGQVAAAIGAMRLVALGLNGTFLHTWYGRHSQYVRATGCACSGLLWALIAIGLWSGDYWSGFLPVAAHLALQDALNCYSAAADAGRLNWQRRNVRSD